MNAWHVYWAFVNSLWQSAALTLAVGTAVRLFRQLSAAQRCALWLAVLVSCAALPVADLMLPARSIPLRPAVIADTAVARLVAPLPHPPPRFEHRTISDRPRFALPDGIALYLWAIVAASLLARLSVGYVRLRSAKAALRRSPALSRRASAWLNGRRAFVGVSEMLPEPCAIGFVRPAVAIPQTLAGSIADADLERILRHECAHVARYDDYANLLRQIVKAVLFFNPAVHIASRNMAIECEIACDDAAACADRERVEFAKCLYEIARASGRRAYSPAAGFFGSRKQIVTRVARLLERNHRTSTRLGIAVKCAFACVLAAGIALGGLRFSAEAQSRFAQSRLAQHFIPSFSSQEIVIGNDTAVRTAPLPAEGAQPWIAGKTAGVRPLLADAGTVPAIVRPRLAQAELVRFHRHEHVNARFRTEVALAAQTETDSGTEGSGDLIDALSAAGYRGLSADDLIELAHHGVSGAFISRLRALGLGPMPAASLVELADHGVTADFIAGMRAAGYSQLNARDLIELADHGVTAGYARDANAALGYTIAVSDLRRMADHGVTTAFIQRIVRSRLAGSRPSVDVLIRLADAGI